MPTGLPGTGGSRTDSDEPVTATMALLRKEIAILQQTTETLRELARIRLAGYPALSQAEEPIRRLAPGYNSPSADLDPAGSRPGRPAGRRLRQAAEPLTRTEEAVLRRLATTLSLREIGRERNVSRDTVKSQVQSIYRKLGVCSRSEAVQRGHELGLLTRRRELRPVC